MLTVDTPLKLVDVRVTQWGLVTIMNPDYSVSKEYEITADEAAAVHAGKALPPGCTREQWESGLVMVASRPCREGDACVNDDGSMIINNGIVKKGDRIEVTLLKVPSSEYEIAAEKIKLSTDAAQQLELTKPVRGK